MAALLMFVVLAAWMIAQSKSKDASLIPIRIEKDEDQRPR
ncbi:MAG: hypothetical protein ACI9DO_001334 [Reinekea sp.]|jgi:hypothetical protein